MEMVQLKVIQEVITLLVFTLFTLVVFRNETIKPNYPIGFLFLILSVHFIYKKLNKGQSEPTCNSPL